ncbi:MAG: hypothetical protein MUO94_04870 [Thermoplasmata archaeon]|nr:hypothetical protein [Thermoplasmata archaeon]
MQSEILRVVDESSRKLFQISSPPVRYWLLKGTMERADDEPVLMQTVEECRHYPPRLRLLRLLREDGTWPIPRQKMLEEDAGPGPPIGWTYVTMLRNLYHLTDSCTKRSEGNVQICLDRILCWQTDEGFVPGPWTAAFPMPHYNGYALRNLLAMGMAGNPAVRKIGKWLRGMQRHDGGWNIPYMQDMRYRPKYAHMTMHRFMQDVERGDVDDYDPADYDDIPSCIWSTMMVVRGLSWDPEMDGQKFLRRGADFMLDRFFKRNHHSSFLQSEKNWTRLKYPTYFGSGLCALEILSSMGYGPDDERMEKPMRWLLNARRSDGFWYQSERPHPDKDQWITEIAINTLHMYSRLR